MTKFEERVVAEAVGEVSKTIFGEESDAASKSISDSEIDHSILMLAPIRLIGPTVHWPLNFNLLEGFNLSTREVMATEGEEGGVEVMRVSFVAMR